MKIVLLIILGLIIIFGVGYLLYDFWKKKHFTINGPKDMERALCREVHKRTIIIVTNFTEKEAPPPLVKYIEASKAVSKKQPAIFPTDDGLVEAFIDKYMEPHWKKSSGTYQKVCLHGKNYVGKFVNMYIPEEHLRPIVDYAKKEIEKREGEK